MGPHRVLAFARADDDRYREVKGSRTVVFVGGLDVHDRGVRHLGRAAISSIADDGSRRGVHSGPSRQDRVTSG